MSDATCLGFFTDYSDKIPDGSSLRQVRLVCWLVSVYFGLTVERDMVYHGGEHVVAEV